MATTDKKKWVKTTANSINLIRTEVATPTLQNPNDIWVLMPLGQLLKLGKERRWGQWVGEDQRKELGWFLHFPSKGQKSPVFLDPDYTFQNLSDFFAVSANYPCNQGAFPHDCFIILAGWALTCLCHFGFRYCKPLTPDSSQGLAGTRGLCWTQPSARLLRCVVLAHRCTPCYLHVFYSFISDLLMN